MKIRTRSWVLFPLLLCAQSNAFSQIDLQDNHLLTRRGDPYNTYRWDGKAALWNEWWYYKVVMPESRKAYYFVYGVVNPGDQSLSTRESQESKVSRTFVGFGDFQKKLVLEERRPVSDFQASRVVTSVKAGDLGLATDRHLSGQIFDKGTAVAWDLSMDLDWKFNAMGWGMYFDFLSNIYWYPAQASAVMNGWIEMVSAGVSERVEVKNAPAYQDRNWGQGFPKWWTWLVSNHFPKSPGTVLAAGGGRPKVFNRRELFNGVVIGLRHEGHEYTFRPTDGDKVRMDIDFGKWEVSAENGNGEKIQISAYAPQSDFMDLPFMTPEGKLFHDYEALLGHMNVKLYRNVGWFRDDWKLITDLDTDEAGIEYGSYNDFGGGGSSLTTSVNSDPRLNPTAVFNERQVVFDTK